MIFPRHAITKASFLSVKPSIPISRNHHTLTGKRGGVVGGGGQKKMEEKGKDVKKKLLLSAGRE